LMASCYVGFVPYHISEPWPKLNKGIDSPT